MDELARLTRLLQAVEEILEQLEDRDTPEAARDAARLHELQAATIQAIGQLGPSLVN